MYALLTCTDILVKQHDCNNIFYVRVLTSEHCIENDIVVLRWLQKLTK